MTKCKCVKTKGGFRFTVDGKADVQDKKLSYLANEIIKEVTDMAHKKGNDVNQFTVLLNCLQHPEARDWFLSELKRLSKKSVTHAWFQLGMTDMTKCQVHGNKAV